MEKHLLFDGRLHVYKRPESKHWQCSTYMAGKNRRISTKQELLGHAKEFAEGWYFRLRGKKEAGLLRDGKTFAEASARFQREYEVITEGHRSARYVDYLMEVLRGHVTPFFGPMLLADITAGTIQDYRLHRAEQFKKRRETQLLRQMEESPKELPRIKPIARNTIANELVAIRQVLKTAQRHGWLATLPDMSFPYKTAGKVGHRAWFSPAEYKQLYRATRRRAQDPVNARWKRECEQLHDFVLFMANTGLRPDEAWRLEYRDVQIVRDQATDDVILEIEVRGKRGVGHCKSMPGAVAPFRRLRERNRPRLTDRLFPSRQRELFNAVLDEEKLKLDRDGNRRTAYSLRHTYICFRLMEGADIYQVAKNCRTSVEMIEKHYAIHLKDTLDAAAINVRRPRPQHIRRRRAKRLDDVADKVA